MHHIFPKKVLYDAGYRKRDVNAIANFTFLTQETNLEVLKRDPVEYLPHYAERTPGAIESHWIPTDPTLEWAVKQGLPEGQIEYELVDSHGHQTAILDLAWPDGLQPGLTQPVCVLIDEGDDVEDAASLGGFRCFSSPWAFRKYVREEILHDGSADDADSDGDEIATRNRLEIETSLPH